MSSKEVLVRYALLLLGFAKYQTVTPRQLLVRLVLAMLIIICTALLVMILMLAWNAD